MTLSVNRSVLKIFYVCWCTLIFICCIAILSFCCFYLFSSYPRLVAWYTGLHDCLFNGPQWADSFFTANVKSSGNIWCVIAIPIAAAAAWLSFREFARGRLFRARQVHIGLPGLLALAACLLPATAFSLFGSKMVAASNDEAYSAVFCAGIHPFQTVSYYMAPNNHILFNLLDNLFFHFSTDKVITGRFISLACYWGLIILFYYWLGLLFDKKWIAAFVTLTIALEFPVWGFSFQARGYELLCVAGWVFFISYFLYHIYGRKELMPLHAAAASIGYFCIPVFLYFHAGLVLFAFVHQVLRKKVDYYFWKYQLVILATVFLLYLPCLCFSGAAALVENKFVSGHTNFSEYLASEALPWIENYIQYIFVWFITDDNRVGVVLFLFPLLLLCYRRNNTAFFLGCFFVAMWGTCFLIFCIMRTFPVARALIVQESITLALTLYTLYLLLSSLARKLGFRVLPFIALPVFCVALCVNYVVRNPGYATYGLCNFEVNPNYEAISYGLSNIVPGCSAAFSDDSYYWYYLSAQRGDPAHMCLHGTENYYVKSFREPFPAGLEKYYFPYKVIDDFTIYMRK